MPPDKKQQQPNAKYATECGHPVGPAESWWLTRKLATPVSFCPACKSLFDLSIEVEMKWDDFLIDEMKGVSTRTSRMAWQAAKAELENARLHHAALRKAWMQAQGALGPEDEESSSEEEQPRRRVRFDDTQEHRPEEVTRRPAEFCRDSPYYRPGIHQPAEGHEFVDTSGATETPVNFDHPLPDLEGQAEPPPLGGLLEMIDETVLGFPNRELHFRHCLEEAFIGLAHREELMAASRNRRKLALSPDLDRVDEESEQADDERGSSGSEADETEVPNFPQPPSTSDE